MRRHLPHLFLACAALLAAASLLLPLAPVFDAWAWLVWGRELAGGELATDAGPSWKPLPVLVSALAAPAGEAAPELWLAVARAGWLLVSPLAGLLAARLAGGSGRRRAAAGVLAGAGCLLLWDPFTPWVRQFAGGLSEPLLSALVLGWALAALARRPRLALTLALAACLLRPEAWPLAAVWALAALRAGSLGAAVVAGGAALVAAAWFVPDLVGAGDALAGAGRARGGTAAPGEALVVLGRALELVPAVLWLGAAFALVAALRPPAAGEAQARRARVALGAAAAAWVGLVAVMAAAGYAGLPRFLVPAGGLVCVLGAVGLVDAAGALRNGLARTTGSAAVAAGLVAALVCLALAADAGVRAARIPDAARDARQFGESLDELFALATRHGDELRRCVPVAVSDLRVQTALAWKLELPLRDVRWAGERAAGAAAVVAGPEWAAALRRRVTTRGAPVGTAGRWRAYRLPACAGNEAMAGVAGGRR